MIYIPEKLILLKESDGTKKTFDRIFLKETLSECFTSSGVNELWLAEDITLMLEEHILKISKQQGSLFTVHKINAMIIQLLNDIGLKDIATLFAKKINVSTFQLLLNEDLTPLIKGRIYNLLKNNPLFMNSNIDEIQIKVENALELLQYKTISDALINQLAIHTVFNKYSDEKLESKPIGIKNILLIKNNDLLKLLPHSAKELLEKKTLKLRNINTLFPKIHFEFDLRMAASQLLDNTELVTELLLFPHIDTICIALKECFKVSIKYIEKNFYLNSQALKYLSVTYLNETSKDILKLKGRYYNNTKREIKNIIQSHLLNEKQLIIKFDE